MHISSFYVLFYLISVYILQSGFLVLFIKQKSAFPAEVYAPFKNLSFH